jgi:hypothetical protein
MKTIIQHIYNSLFEGRTVNEITIKDQNNKEVNVAYYCYDKASLNKVADQYDHIGKYWDDKGFFLATLKNKSSWVVDMNEEYNMHTWRPNADFIECNNGKKKYTYKELLELIEQGETMLVVINK